MKTTGKQTAIFLIILSLTTFYPGIINADPSPGMPGLSGGGGSPSGGQTVDSGGSSGVPLDGGIIELLVAGAAVAGLNRLRAIKRKQ